MTLEFAKVDRYYMRSKCGRYTVTNGNGCALPYIAYRVGPPAVMLGDAARKTSDEAIADAHADADQQAAT